MYGPPSKTEMGPFRNACSIVFALVLALAAVACAEGYPSAAQGTGPAQQPELARKGSPNFKGDACMRGAEMPCQCPDGSEGYKLCAPDPNSPTQAAFSPCLSCPEPPLNPEATTPPQTNGTMGTAGMSSMAGRGATGTSSAQGGGGGTGGGGGRAASAGRGGSTGSAGGSTGSAAGMGSGRGDSSGGPCDCSDEPCFPVGVIGCCRDDGTCGCTWAPGAYCL